MNQIYLTKKNSLEVEVFDANLESAFQFSLNWDSNIMTFVSYGQFGVSGLSEGNFQQITPGELGVAWADPKTAVMVSGAFG